jgi:membrane protein implicated in regulation of membrane protease activity
MANEKVRRAIRRARRASLVRYILEILAGDTIIVSYTTKGGIEYTWYINDNWLMLIAFIVSAGITSLIKRRRKRARLRTRTNPRGGSLIHECISSDKAYELIDEDLKKIIRTLIKESSIVAFLKQSFVSKGPLVITPYIFFLSTVLRAHPGAQLAILGAEITVNNFLYTNGRIGVGIVGGTFVVACIQTTIMKLLFIVLSGVSAAFVGFMLQQVDCTQLVRELSQIPIPIEQIGSAGNPDRYFLDVPKSQLHNTVILKDFQFSDKSEFYRLEKSKNEVCSVPVDKFNKISQKCDHERIYHPIAETRLSEKDIQRWDSSDITKKAMHLQRSYERVMKKLKNEKKVEIEEQQKQSITKSEVIQSVIEDVVKPSTTPSTSVTEYSNSLFRNPKRNSISIPLSKRTNTLEKMRKTLQESNVGGYPYPSDDVSKSTFRPSDKIPENMKEPTGSPIETSNSESEEL